jgi:hypothetical protein
VHKVLITTYVASTYGNAVSTVVAEFDAKQSAVDAVHKINKTPQLGGLVYRHAELLA